jgi:acyl carrier protein
LNVREKLETIFRDVFDDAEIDIYEELTADDIENWDSLTHIQLIVAVEQEFSVKFQTAEVISLKNVGEFMELLKEKSK